MAAHFSDTLAAIGSFAAGSTSRPEATSLCETAPRPDAKSRPESAPRPEATSQPNIYIYIIPSNRLKGAHVQVQRRQRCAQLGELIRSLQGHASCSKMLKRTGVRAGLSSPIALWHYPWRALPGVSACAARGFKGRSRGISIDAPILRSEEYP